MAKKKRIAAKKTAQVKKKAIATKKKTVVKKKTVKKAPASLKTVTANQRLVIHTNDITKILGINIRTAQRLLQTIREELGRKKKDYVSIKEFADYVHLGEDEVKQNLSETLLN